MRDVEMHVMAALGTILLSAALVVPTAWLGNGQETVEASLKDMELIEASVAYKKPSKPKQPQKPRQAPNPEAKPQGVSRDETKQVEPKPKEPEPAKATEVTDPLAQFRRPQDDDTDVGAQDEQDGSADGETWGRGNITKGDPYLQRLWRDLDWSAPTLAKSGAIAPQPCLSFKPDGTVKKTWFKQKGDDDLATLAESALRELAALRNASPEEVPIHLLERLTTEGVCFNLTAT